MRRHETTTVAYLGSSAEPDFDWIYVDADHGYEAVVADIARAKGRVKPGGLLVFNDFARIVRPGFGVFGVHQAVCEFAVAEGWARRLPLAERGGAVRPRAAPPGGLIRAAPAACDYPAAPEEPP